jgi:ADP-ribose pyrophosphatase YjhB (NUDIX family)
VFFTNRDYTSAVLATNLYLMPSRLPSTAAPTKSGLKAGGVVYRETGRGARRVHEILLVTSKSDPRRWILPKGTAEPGETIELTAHREIEEEGGVHGEMIGRLGVVRRTNQVITYFLFRAAGAPTHWTESALRARRWVLLHEAERHLSQSDLHGIVHRARRVLARA